MYLSRKYPTLTEAFEILGPISIDVRDEVPVAEALTRIVIGQMLSAKAATSIYQRVEQANCLGGHDGSWRLEPETLVSCGLSQRKVRAIKEFGNSYDADPEYFEAWRHLKFNELAKLVSGHWGMSMWTADMLAIFYFGFPDVFPTGDSSINRAIENLQAIKLIPKQFNPMAASPYRTYLSLYFWKLIDTKLLASLTTRCLTD